MIIKHHYTTIMISLSRIIIITIIVSLIKTNTHYLRRTLVPTVGDSEVDGFIWCGIVTNGPLGIIFIDWDDDGVGRGVFGINCGCKK